MDRQTLELIANDSGRDWPVRQDAMQQLADLDAAPDAPADLAAYLGEITVLE